MQRELAGGVSDQSRQRDQAQARGGKDQGGWGARYLSDDCDSAKTDQRDQPSRHGPFSLA